MHHIIALSAILVTLVLLVLMLKRWHKRKLIKRYLKVLKESMDSEFYKNNREIRMSLLSKLNSLDFENLVLNTDIEDIEEKIKCL